jgi:hypothetical protein
MLEGVENDLFDGDGQIADSELLDESPEVLRDHALFRERGVGHDW